MSTFWRAAGLPYLQYLQASHKLRIQATSVVGNNVFIRNINNGGISKNNYSNRRNLSSSASPSAPQSSKRKIKRGLYSKDNKSLHDFLVSSSNQDGKNNIKEAEANVLPPYVAKEEFRMDISNKHFFIKSYGCQMNVSDSEIVRAILSGVGYRESKTEEDADILLINTCAIRDKAESRIWKKLKELRHLNEKKKKERRQTIGVLGCMAERLKDDLLEKEKAVDLVVGPDAYRDLPILLNAINSTSFTNHDNKCFDSTNGDYAAINVQLSVDETYGDIKPIRDNHSSISAFTSIQRGCNNRCSFCIVPFTRGIERSRDLESIVDEVKILSEEGYKEVTLLGQNVNTWKPQRGVGTRFAELLAAVAQVDRNMRVRFTSPHPKDFPSDVLHCIAENPNICRGIHLPVQSGSSRMLDIMRRGHTREEYLKLVEDMRAIIPNVELSTDMISGFCGETEEDHLETISLLKHVRYQQAFMFAYSMREKTRAHRRMVDDVPQDVKLKRLQEVVNTFRETALDYSKENDLNDEHIVLVEGESKRSSESSIQLTGKNDGFKRCVFSNTFVDSNSNDGVKNVVKPGDYVVVKALDIGVSTLQCEVLRYA
jgi:tRNA-N(6)-(isopentenyl)adenosine-37 thiotransferase enzyme MiaB